MDDDSCVRVAVRIRPQIPREVIDMCRVCTSVTPNEPQVWLGSDKAFTFDDVFDTDSIQENVYHTCVQDLVDGCLEGYNATVLAYGQTGSGKTYTMGTVFEVDIPLDEYGIIPRAVHHLFESIKERQRSALENRLPVPEFQIHCQFIELYNEEIIDLFDNAREPDTKNRRSNIRIHEDTSGAIYTVGVITQHVTSEEETVKCLRRGALSRTTATTQMNVASSRSHAIFTLVIKQQRIVLSKDPDFDIDTTDGMNEFETLSAKFHFVDLAGSERLKRTGATGDRAKEGISINCGLLALGNVISALGDKLKKGSHVPYRDSKLTRLLQDSLGGNSRTLMIACISPSDRDFMETLNTLKYANRARNIKNRVIVNQDKTSRTITSLRMEIQALQLELLEYKQGKRVLVDGVESVNDMFHENTMLQTESNNLRTRVKAMQETIETLTVKNVALLAEKTAGIWITSGDEKSEISQLIQTYLKDIEDLRAKLMESEHTCEILRRNVARSQSRLSMSPMHSHPLGFAGSVDVDDACAIGVIEEAKRDLLQLKRTIRSRTRSETFEKMEGQENDSKNENDEDDANGVEEDSSDSESEEMDEQCRADLADITCEISIKQKLIDELELSQKRMQTLRKQYEDKLLQLQNKIRATQEERDRVLANLGSRDDQSGDKSRKVKAEYEKKLADLQSQLNKLHSAQKEHAKLVKNQSEYEKQMRNLKTEMADMKKTKVRLMNKIKEEANRHKEAETRRNREIAQLKKDSRVKENQIRTMEAAAKLKDAVLKRKHEEMAALRKGSKPMSDKVAGRFQRPFVDNRTILRNKRQATVFSPKVAKNKWQHLEKDITKIVLNKHAITTMEKDMDSALKDRQILRDKLDKYKRKRDKAIRLGKDRATIQELEDHIENITANIDYIQERISDSQAHIIQIEESKDAKDVLDSATLLEGLNFEEARYLVDKLMAMTINQSLTAAQKDIGLKEMEAKCSQLSQNNNIQQQLLEHMLVQQDLSFASVLNLSETPDSGESLPSTRSTSPVGSDVQHLLEDIVIPVPPIPPRSMDKVRRRTATPQELLYVKNESENDSDLTGSAIQEEDTLVPKPEIIPNELTYTLQRHSSSATVHKIPLIITTTLGITQPNSLDNTPVPTPPLSPTPSLRRLGREGNVFSRLTAGDSKIENGIHNRGRIGIASSNNNNKLAKVETPFSLVCTHVAEGHSKAVLSVAADETYLFSASKDRTVKMWDLQKAEEIQSLSGHPNNVVSVRYSSRDQLVFSVSSAFIKIWDIRSNTCVKTLSSSGMTTHGEIPLATPSRTLQMPNGESQINDIILDRHGSVLYSASSSSVRVWDLRKFQCVGKLSGGHQAAVMCLAVGDCDIGSSIVFTGSKDHYIRLFDVCGDLSGIQAPKHKLEPPHYDGIEALTVADGVLFSGSRDACIKKWDLNSKKPIHSISKAHKDWVCGLLTMPSKRSVLSCCRSGHLKQWNIDDCKLIGEVKAPKQVNGIAKNSSAIFTASEDGTVGIWRHN